MTYFLNKIVGWILSPAGILFSSLAVSLAFARIGRTASPKAVLFAKLSRWIAVASVAFYWFMGTGLATRMIGAPLERPWERPESPHGGADGFPSADAIVVLGGGIGTHRCCGAPEMFSAADRVWLGARLFKKGNAKIVSLSGADADSGSAPLLEDLGVPRDAVLCFPDARNTEEESRLLRENLKASSGDARPAILLVTSAWHMTRAKLLFERAGFDVIPAPADFEMSFVSECPLGMADFIPSAEALQRNSAAVKEWIAILGYGFLRR